MPGIENATKPTGDTLLAAFEGWRRERRPAQKVDVVAYYPQEKRCVIAEVEGASTGQPEQKLYKAIGQMVRTVSDVPPGWNTRLLIVVHGDRIARHLQRAHALVKLDVAGLALADDARDDRWLFGKPLLMR